MVALRRPWDTGGRSARSASDHLRIPVCSGVKVSTGPQGLQLFQAVAPVIKQTVEDDEELFRAGCSVLGSIAAHGGVEAGVYLVGLLAYYRERPERLSVVVPAVASFAHAAAAEALIGELYRVPSSNATRRYLGEALDALTKLPRDLWQTRVASVAVNSWLLCSARRP